MWWIYAHYKLLYYLFVGTKTCLVQKKFCLAKVVNQPEHHTVTILLQLVSCWYHREITGTKNKILKTSLINHFPPKVTQYENVFNIDHFLNFKMELLVTPFLYLCIAFMTNTPVFDVFSDLRQKYGTIFSLKFASRNVVVLNTIEVIREAMVNQAVEFAGRPRIQSSKSILGLVTVLLNSF